MITLLMLKKILERAEHYNWTIQGFGMLRLYLSREVRLHVWDPSRAFPGVSTIHTHPWDFTSEILVGRLTDLVYAKDYPGPNYHFKPHAMNQQQIMCGVGACVTSLAKEVLLYAPKEGIAYRAGQSYTMRADEIHESIPDRGCVSIITRRFKADTEHADVYYRAGTTWVASEPRPATPDEIRSMCDAALELMP